MSNKKHADSEFTDSPATPVPSAWSGILKQSLRGLPGICISYVEARFIAAKLSHPNQVRNETAILLLIRDCLEAAYSDIALDIAGKKLNLTSSELTADMLQAVLPMTVFEMTAFLREQAGGDAYTIIEKTLTPKEG